jgi:hypothetical protein
MKTFEWIIFKNLLKARGLHPLGAPSVDPIDFYSQENKVMISKAQDDSEMLISKA